MHVLHVAKGFAHHHLTITLPVLIFYNSASSTELLVPVGASCRAHLLVISTAQICTRTAVFIIPKFFMASLYNTSLICVLLLDNYTIKLRAQKQFILSKRICIHQIIYGAGGTFCPSLNLFSILYVFEQSNYGVICGPLFQKTAAIQHPC